MAETPSRSAKAYAALLDPKSGRADARHVAQFLGLSPPALAEAIGETPRAMLRAPTAPRLQRGLRPLVRIAVSLLTLFDDAEQSQDWLNAPHPELDNVAPIDLVKRKKASVVADLLEDALLGHPG